MSESRSYLTLLYGNLSLVIVKVPAMFNKVI